MTQLKGSEDIYRQLVDESEESWILGLLAFAVIEEQRIEWMKHHADNNGGSIPGADEVAKWYEQQPPSILLKAKGTAENALKAYADEVLEILIEDARQEIEQSLILTEIRETRKFWPQFGVNLAGGFISALLFAVLLTAFALLVFNDTSPVEIAKSIASGE